MAHHEPQAGNIRRLVLAQLAIASGFSALIALILGGTDADLPPWWVMLGFWLLLVAVVADVERSWTRFAPLAPSVEPGRALAEAFAAYQRYVARSFLLMEIPLVAAALYAFVADHGGWPVILVALPTIVALTAQTWPSLRNVSRLTAALEADGVDSGLIEAFAAESS